MKIKNTQFVLSVIGAILIIVNGVWIALEGKPIIISSYPAESLNDIEGTWGRISFGIPSLVHGQAVVFWLVLAVGNLLSIVMRYLGQKNQSYYGLCTLLLSLLSFSIGGGFFIGMILTIILSMTAIENKPFKETFLGKMLRAARLDSTFYENIKSDFDGLRNAALTIIFINILTGVGNGLYILNANKILNGDPIFPEIEANILLKGEVLFGISVLGTITTYIGLAVMKWFFFAAIIYFVIRIADGDVEFKTMAYCVAFAYTPIAIQLFMPLVFFNGSFLTVEWPLAFFFLSNIWMGIALAFAIKKVADLSLTKAFGSMILGSAIYYLINYGIIEQRFAIQGIRFIIQPAEILEMFLSIAVLIALILGVFSKHEGKTPTLHEVVK